MDTDTTEMVEMQADEVHAVGSPANGTPWLLVKASDDMETCSTCKGDGKIMDGKRECPDCKGKGEIAKKSESAEADAEEEEVTGSKAQKEEWEALDKALSEDDRSKMPSSSFAFVDKNGKKHLPVHDEGHVKSALGRFAQQDFSEAKGDPADAKKKAAAKILSAAKSHGVDVDDKSTVAEAAKKSTGVPDESVEEPKAAGHLDTGKSGAVGSVAPAGATGGNADVSNSSLTLGGQTTAAIPVEAKVSDYTSGAIPATTDAAGIVNSQGMAKGIVSLAEAMEVLGTQRRALKDGKFLSADGDAALTPGSMPWESYDAATLKQVAECLAGCCAALDNLAQREREESMSADPGDIENAWDLEEAAQALDYAMGVAARLSFSEAVESGAAKSVEDGDLTKVGRKLSGKNTSALRAARDHLNAVIDGAETKADDGPSSEEDEIMITATKEELGEFVTKTVLAVKQAEKEEKKAAKKAAEEEAAKNANNGGDIAEGDIKPTKTANADDVNAVPNGGSVNGEYVNKGADDEPVTIESLQKQIEGMNELLTRMAKRPQRGNPSLDGQVRPAAEARQQDGAVAKSDDELEALQKSFDEEVDPAKKAALGERLTYERLVRLHDGGQL